VTRSLSRALALAALLALALTATASAATVRTAATPAQLRAGYPAYAKAVTAGFAKATKSLDHQLKKHPRKPTVVLDIDETTMSNWTCLDAVDFDLSGLATCVVGSKSMVFPAAKAFIKHARAKKVSMAFITGAPQVVCGARKTNLVAQGIAAPFSLTCRQPGDTTDSVVPYKSKARKALQKHGATIVLNIGDQASDLAGGAAKATVKLPNPVYTIS
jgi:predicted secreted acid phosphatase